LSRVSSRRNVAVAYCLGFMGATLPPVAVKENRTKPDVLEMARVANRAYKPVMAVSGHPES
jgi:hypothetical protein